MCTICTMICHICGKPTAGSKTGSSAISAICPEHTSKRAPVARKRSRKHARSSHVVLKKPVEK